MINHVGISSSDQANRVEKLMFIIVDLMFYKYLNKVFIKIKNGIEPLY